VKEQKETKVHSCAEITNECPEINKVNVFDKKRNKKLEMGSLWIIITALRLYLNVQKLGETHYS
jgi:ADP-heptose:LPS heptosyltransferase